MTSFALEVADGVATLTLDRPERLNALTFEVYADLRDFFQALPDRADVRAVVITGRGRAFCSGGDVHEIIGPLVEADAEAHLEFTRMTGAVIHAMRDCPQPIVAAVNGTAAGAGAVIALAADLRVVARSAKFAFLFTKVGLAGADMGAAYLLPRVVGLGRASELLLLGDAIDAETADRYGLVTRLVDDEAVLGEASELARRLASGPAPCLRGDEATAHPRARPRPDERDRARGRGAGAADGHARLPRVPRRVHGEAQAEVGGALVPSRGAAR